MMAFSIFMDSRVRRVSPFFTAWPSDTSTLITDPGSGLFTWSPAAGAAAGFGASALGAGAAAGFGAGAGAGLAAGLGAGATGASVSTVYTLPFTVTFVLPASISSTAHLYSAPLILNVNSFIVLYITLFLALKGTINVGQKPTLFIPIDFVFHAVSC